jgi:hypothetical protein
LQEEGAIPNKNGPLPYSIHVTINDIGIQRQTEAKKEGKRAGTGQLRATAIA